MKLKRGTKRADGLVFLSYAKCCVGGEHWGTEDQLKAFRCADSDRKKEYRKSNAQRISQLRKERYAKKRELILKQSKDSYLRHRDRRVSDAIDYYNRVKDTPEFREKSRRRQAAWRAKSPENQLVHNLRTRLSSIVSSSGCKKSCRTMEMLGCDKAFLKQWLEERFLDGMTWENYGEWSIDHIVPLSCSKTADGLTELFHYSNLTPVWASDNSSKCNRHGFGSDQEALEFAARAKLKAASVEVVVTPSEGDKSP
jgi:hypothetical protein